MDLKLLSDIPEMQATEDAVAPSVGDTPPGTPDWRRAVGGLHGALVRSGYRAIEHIPTVRNLLALPVELGNLWVFFSGRGRRLNQPSAAPGLYRRLQRWRDGELERRLAFFFLGESFAADEIDALLAKLPGAPDLALLVETGIIRTAGEGALHCRLLFAPVGDLLIVADRDDRSISDFVYIGRDSMFFAEQLRRRLRGRRFRRALDLCSGTGVQGLTAAAFADSVEGTDINPRAAAYGNLNAELAGLGARVRFSAGNLAEVKPGPYDLVVANPPYVFMPIDQQRINRDGYGGELGLEIAGRIVSDLDRLLDTHGEAHMVCDSPVIAGEAALEALIGRVLRGTRMGASLTYVRYLTYRQFAELHASRGISHVVYNYVRIGRDLPPGVHVRRLPMLRRAANSAFVRLARRR